MEIVFEKRLVTMIINEIKTIIDYNTVNPSFIYNRLDTVCENYVILQTDYQSKQFTVSVVIDKISYMGIWLMNVPQVVVHAFAEFIFKHYKHVHKIEYGYSLNPHGFSTTGVHYKIELPQTEDELIHRLSKKSRYNTKREKDIIEKTFGDYRVDEYSADNCPNDVILHYFNLKSKTHITDYNLTPEEYLRKYHVSNIYILRMSDIIGAILFSCEQFDTVYIENLTYDEKYAKFSCGKALYDIVLKKLIQKGKKEVFLGGGELEYKKKYGSIMDNVFNGCIYRNKSIEKFMQCKQIAKNIIKKMIGR